jgi:hypothetical protein
LKKKYEKTYSKTIFTCFDFFYLGNPDSKPCANAASGSVYNAYGSATLLWLDG